MSQKGLNKNDLMLKHWSANPDDVIQLSRWTQSNIFKVGNETFATIKEAHLHASQKERAFGNTLIRSTRVGPDDNTGNWTTVAVESFVEFILHHLYGNVWRPKYKSGNHEIRPDFETNIAVFEVKAKTWNGSGGTAGEKIFAVPWKYGELPQRLNKPLVILLVAAQEEEVRKKYGMFGGNISSYHSEYLKFWESQNIHFVPFSRLLQKYQKSIT